MGGMGAIVYVFAIVAFLGFLIGTAAGGVVGWLRGETGVGVGCGMVGGAFGGVIGFAIGICLENAVYIRESSTLLFIYLLLVAGGSLTGAILCAVVFVKRPTTLTDKEPRQDWNAQ